MTTRWPAAEKVKPGVVERPTPWHYRLDWPCKAVLNRLDLVDRLGKDTVSPDDGSKWKEH